MNSLEIRNLVNGDDSLKTKFGGVISADDLKIINLAKRNFFIVNTQAKHFPGKHWVCLYISDIIEFWDSVGNKPEFYGHYFTDFFKNVSYIYNERRLQGQENSCAHFCI